MKSSLITGITRRDEHSVTTEMTASHLPVGVLSTPTMIALIEYTCMEAAAPHLDEQENTVGTAVCVTHQASTALGEGFTVSCVLTSIEKRRLNFDVEVVNDRDTVSRGTHQRAVVDVRRIAGH
jgi:fluoroacetyl-CoA thioesterase